MKIDFCDTYANGGTDASDFGALAFKLSKSGHDDLKSYVLFQGGGRADGTHAAEYIFGRDTVYGNVAVYDKFFTLTAPYGNSGSIKTKFNNAIEVPTPTADAHAATKAYVDSHSNSISGGFQEGTWTATFDSTGTTPNSKVTKTGHYVKVGKMVHLNLHFTGQSFNGYDGGTIRIKGVPFQPSTSLGKQVGTIHGVNFMVNNYHADDGHIALLGHDNTFGSFIKVISEQVNEETTYIPNTTGAEVSISITLVAIPKS